MRRTGHQAAHEQAAKGRHPRSVIPKAPPRGHVCEIKAITGNLLRIKASDTLTLPASCQQAQRTAAGHPATWPRASPYSSPQQQNHIPSQRAYSSPHATQTIHQCVAQRSGDGDTGAGQARGDVKNGRRKARVMRRAAARIRHTSAGVARGNEDLINDEHKALNGRDPTPHPAVGTTEARTAEAGQPAHGAARAPASLASRSVRCGQRGPYFSYWASASPRPKKVGAHSPTKIPQRSARSIPADSVFADVAQERNDKPMDAIAAM